MRLEAPGTSTPVCSSAMRTLSSGVRSESVCFASCEYTVRASPSTGAVTADGDVDPSEEARDEPSDCVQ